jgi:hypothetical protein
LPLLLSLVACSNGSGPDDDLPPAHTGQVIPAALSSQIEGRHSYVALPGRRYDFTVSSPQEKIDSISSGDAGVSQEAGDDRRFVEIAWELNVALGDGFVMESPEDVSPMLTLNVDGERHRVGALDEEGVSAAIVVVPEDADDIGLEIEYDGLAQAIDDVYDPISSRADGPDLLYFEAPSVRWESCPETSLSGGDPAVSFFGADCQANISSPVPYFGPLGWAPEGRAWVVVRFLAGSPAVGYDAPGEYVEYTVDPSEVRLRLEGSSGAPELFPLEEGAPVGAQDDGSWEAQAVFSVDDSVRDPRLSFRRVLFGLPDDEDEAAAAGAPRPIKRVHAGEL